MKARSANFYLLSAKVWVAAALVIVATGGSPLWGLFFIALACAEIAAALLLATPEAKSK